MLYESNVKGTSDSNATYPLSDIDYFIMSYLGKSHSNKIKKTSKLHHTDEKIRANWH